MKGSIKMSNSHVAKLSQLFTEGMLLYFFLVPIFAVLSSGLPLWSYLFIIVISIFLLAVSVHFIKNYVVYVVNLFLMLFLLLDVFRYPLLTALAIPVYMIWRFHEHEKSSDMHNQITIILFMLILLTFDALFFYHENLIVVTMFMVVSIFIGYYGAQMFNVPKENTLQSVKYILSIMGMLLANSILLYFCFGLIKFLVKGIWYGFKLLIHSMAWVIGKGIALSGLDFEAIQGFLEQHNSSLNGKTLFEKVDMKPFIPKAEIAERTGGLINWWTIAILVILLIAITIFLFKKKFQRLETTEDSKMIVGSGLDNTNVHKRREKLFSTVKKPNNIIRLDVLNFEQWALKLGVGRKFHETIEEWFERLGIDSQYLDLYQKVRYGNLDELTKTEIESFHKQLDEMKSLIKNKFKENG